MFEAQMPYDIQCISVTVVRQMFKIYATFTYHNCPFHVLRESWINILGDPPKWLSDLILINAVDFRAGLTRDVVTIGKVNKLVRTYCKANSLGLPRCWSAQALLAITINHKLKRHVSRRYSN